MESMADSKILRDPVCEMPLESAETKYTLKCASFGDKVYYFCSENCRRGFVENPRIAYFSM